jgi:hypothetical protein
MNITAETGKVIWASNSLITETSGSMRISSTVGTMHQGTGFIAGGGGGGSISTTRANVEKLRISKFASGEINVQIECEPLFSVGNVATVVKRGNERLAFYNQTTDRWFHYKLGLTLKQMGVVAGSTVLLVFLLWKTFWAYWDSSMSRGYFFFPNVVVEIVVLCFYAGLAVSLAVWIVRFIREKRKAVKEGVMAIVREEAARYAAEIARSKDLHRKMVDDL